MEDKLFWRVVADICQIGEFIAATGADGASANIVGEFRVSYDGSENVIEKKECHDHVHLYPAQIKAFHFSYRDVGYGAEPCLELTNLHDQVSLRLYYRGRDAKQKYQQFVEQHQDCHHLFTGEW
jgi:hypothetical protein